LDNNVSPWGSIMTDVGHLWAVGFDDVARAEQVRDMIASLAWGPGRGGKDFFLEDIAVVVRHIDGSFSFARKPFSGAGNILGCSVVGFLAGLVLAEPLTGATVGAVLGGVGTAAAAAAAGIGEEFIRDVERMMKPGSSALFVLDDEGDMEVILHEIRGLGGTVLKTNADQERARLIQSTLAAHTDDS
jgi:uncharacterized membrane protein